MRLSLLSHIMHLSAVQRQSTLYLFFTVVITIFGFVSTMLISHLLGKDVMVVSLLFTAYYGVFNMIRPGDNFNPNSSHLIPAPIKKFIDAKEMGTTSVEVWGTGAVSREFFYVDDAGHGIVLVAELYNSLELVNIGARMEITIRELVDLITALTKFDGEIVWDTSTHYGQPRRCLDVSVAEREFGFSADVAFSEGMMKKIRGSVNG